MFVFLDLAEPTQDNVSPVLSIYLQIPQFRFIFATEYDVTADTTFLLAVHQLLAI